MSLCSLSQFSVSGPSPGTQTWFRTSESFGRTGKCGCWRSDGDATERFPELTATRQLRPLQMKLILIPSTPSLKESLLQAGTLWSELNGYLLQPVIKTLPSSSPHGSSGSEPAHRLSIRTPSSLPEQPIHHLRPEGTPGFSLHPPPLDTTTNPPNEGGRRRPRQTCARLSRSNNKEPAGSFVFHPNTVSERP